MYPRPAPAERQWPSIIQGLRTLAVLLPLPTVLYLLSQSDGCLANGDCITSIKVVNSGNSSIVITFFDDKPYFRKNVVQARSTAEFRYYIGSSENIDYHFYSTAGKLLASGHAATLSDVRHGFGIPTFVYSPKK